MFSGDTESWRFFGEVWILFRDAGFRVPQQPLERAQWRKPGDPERFGSDHGLSIHVVMGDRTLEKSPRNSLALAIAKAWNDSVHSSEQAMGESPIGTGEAVPKQKELILWIGAKKVNWLEHLEKNGW
jgi:hypothetical protein